MSRFATLALASATLAALLTAAPASAQAQPPLAIGDDAPALDAEYWYGGGEPVRRLEPGRIYLIEFWATWCRPCIENIPRLQALQKQYADRLTIVGVTVELPHEVEEFLSETGLRGNLDYALAVDPDSSIFDDYMHGTLSTTIPTVFLVGQTGRLEWVGHPRDAEPILERMLAGRWDRYAAQAWHNTAVGLERALADAFDAGVARNTLRALDRLLEHYDSDAAPPSLDRTVMRYESLRTELLLSDGQTERGYSCARAFMTRNWDAAPALNNLAWFIVDAPELAERDLPLARALAERANELSGFQNAIYLDTLARVLFEQGEQKQALRLQEQAVDMLPLGVDATPFTQALERYRQGQTPETPNPHAP